MYTMESATDDSFQVDRHSRDGGSPVDNFHPSRVKLEVLGPTLCVLLHVGVTRR